MKFRAISILTAILFLTPTLCLAKRLHPEKWYQDRWCAQNGGKPAGCFQVRMNHICNGQFRRD